jgi:serine/threonine protein kinase
MNELSIVLAALGKADPVERAAYLNEVCGTDAPLRRSVEEQLQARERAGGASVAIADHASDVTAGPTTDQPPNRPIAEAPGSWVGPYKLLQQVGEGGMGTVFLAEQDKPVRRRVALKVIKPGMDSAHVLARFEAERQALALMDHPNIARVFDAGTTDTGRPYFVMELVKGVPITEYCDANHLTPRERLEFFVPVCQAIQHAHQKGIIHRDIKPSNVMVTLHDGVPVPKVIDFGVAKAIEQRLTERTLFTQLGAVVGTPMYMSPEQAGISGLDIDTRSDIYSLGVLLYELLTGSTPLPRARLRQAAFPEMLRRIHEEEPPKPSTRLSTTEELPAIAAHRKTEPAKLARLVRGELDWIVMKCLEKDRTRRYETANGLARDLQRYLADEPVEAGPPSAAYRLRKYARKHRAALAMTGAFAAVLVVTTGVSLWQAVRATQEESKAKRSASESQAVLGFFENRVLAAARPEGQKGGLGHDVTLREALHAAEKSIAAAFVDQPVVEAAIRHTLGETYLYLQERERAIRQFERARALREAKLGPDHPQTLASMNKLASAYRDANRRDDVIALHEEALRLRKARLGPDHLDTLESMNNLAIGYSDAGRFDDAIALLEEVLRLFKAKLGPDHPDTLLSMNNLATTYGEAGRLDDEIALQEETLKLLKARLGPGDSLTILSMHNLSAAYREAGRLGDALALGEETLRLRKAKTGPDHLFTLRAMGSLAETYREAGRLGDALALHEETLRLRKAKLGPDHPDTLISMNNLARAHLGASRWAEAETLLRECLALREKKQPDEWWRYRTMSQLGAALAGQAKYAEAEPLLIGGYAGLKAREAKIVAFQKKKLAEAAARIVPFYESWGKPEKAAQWRKKLQPTVDAETSKP